MHMQISVVYAAAMLVIGYLFGAAIQWLCDRALLKSRKRNELLAHQCTAWMVQACREVLADSWFHKVMKQYKLIVEKAEVAS